MPSQSLYTTTLQTSKRIILLMQRVPTVDLFAQEMKYLHNNGFKVLLLNQLGFNSIDNVFYLTRAVSSIHSTTN